MKSGLKLSDFKSACETSTSAKTAFLIAHFLLSASHQHILVVHLLPLFVLYSCHTVTCLVCPDPQPTTFTTCHHFKEQLIKEVTHFLSSEQTLQEDAEEQAVSTRCSINIEQIQGSISAEQTRSCLVSTSSKRLLTELFFLFCFLFSIFNKQIKQPMRSVAMCVRSQQQLSVCLCICLFISLPSLGLSLLVVG